MKRSKFVSHRLFSDRRGLTALEYGLIGSVLFAVVMAGFAEMADTLSNEFTNIGGTLASTGL